MPPMRKMKAMQGILFSCAMICAVVMPVHAEGEDFTDTSYWNNLCTNTSSLTEEQQASCTAYMNYMASQNASLQQRINDIDAQKDDINNNIAYYASQISSYNTQIEDLNYMILDLNAQIADAQNQIADMQGQIDDTQVQINDKNDEVDTLKKKVAERMVKEQQNMRTYRFLDVLMGAKTFDQFIRVANGMSDISAYDTRTLQQLQDAIGALNDMQAQLKEQQDELSNMEAGLQDSLSALDSQQTTLLSAKYELQTIQSSYQAQLASADEEQRAALAAITSNNSSISNITTSINDSKNAAASPSASTASPSSNGGTTVPTAAPQQSTPAPAVPTQPAYSGPSYGDSSANPYWGGWQNCTWSAWQIAHDTLGVTLPRWGNAGEWLGNAAAQGWSTGSSPRVNSIWVTSYHVGFVTAVDGNRIYIREGNYQGHYNERWVRADNCLGYIYL